MARLGSKLNTRQKRVVEEQLARFTEPFTARDLCLALAPGRSGVSRATVYRILAGLCREGRVREVALPDGSRVYANPSPEGPICIIECGTCGRLTSCVAPALESSLSKALRQQKLRVVQTSVYVRAACADSECGHRKPAALPLRKRALARVTVA